MDNFSVSFWIYRLTSRNDENRPFFGLDSEDFIISKDSQEKLEFTIAGISFSSNGKMLTRRWTFWVFNRQGESCEIYVNGFLDSIHYCPSVTIRGDIRLGGPDSIEAYFDEIKIFSRGLSEEEISGSIPPGTTGLAETHFVRLGCLQCSLQDIRKEEFCPESFVLCSEKQIHEFGFHISRINGWLTEPIAFWSAAETMTVSDESRKKLALCCKVDNKLLSDI
eukprot:GHVP01068451.1.p1 GENE.GHVP01068451.1~~GHVP01068451.1.p1  ORF type:complete len:222 (+),score=32.83 GHVP01068451.1:387-1052(+)